MLCLCLFDDEWSDEEEGEKRRRCIFTIIENMMDEIIVYITMVFFFTKLYVLSITTILTIDTHSRYNTAQSWKFRRLTDNWPYARMQLNASQFKPKNVSLFSIWNVILLIALSKVKMLDYLFLSCMWVRVFLYMMAIFWPPGITFRRQKKLNLYFNTN